MNAGECRMINRIRDQYINRPESDLDKLKALDRKVKTPARVFAYVFGTIGALVLGSGMCLAMNVIEKLSDLMIPGIGIGLVGIAMVSFNYFIYKAILKSSKKKHAQEIIAISDSMLAAQ